MFSLHTQSGSDGAGSGGVSGGDGGEGGRGFFTLHSSSIVWFPVLIITIMMIITIAHTHTLSYCANYRSAAH